MELQSTPEYKWMRGSWTENVKWENIKFLFDVGCLELFIKSGHERIVFSSCNYKISKISNVHGGFVNIFHEFVIKI